ncbi:MAG TPA: TIGR02996 domain-containing protein [Urbifossiella sp.]|jgi:uncharacterized protein (TIGR02996 family)|nr:TIGR02996 domain-containing protein [Urbifossiella sp.]
MTDPNEAAFLRAIAAEADDDTGRLAFADWLEERGDADRAEFIRVQCGLRATGLSEDGRLAHHAYFLRRSSHTHIATGLSEDGRLAHRRRERALLDAHRREWCEELGLPVEDALFERGLLARVRLPGWDDGRVLNPEYAPRFASLTELDLSGVRPGDVGLAAFARSAEFPMLRKLILSETGITAAGATALADATGLPRLETVYLFGNTVSPAALAALTRSARFRLVNLDAGERADGYCMSPGEAEMGRRQWLRTQLLPVVTRYFETYERLQCAALCVAQYWADEADDAVHAAVVVSELFEPTLQGVSWDGEEGHTDPNLPTTPIKSRYGGGTTSVIGLWDSGAPWDDNSGAIPLWAGFAPEGGSQDYGELSESYAPAAMFYRHGGYEVLPMQRPHLDGVRPEWGREE